MSHQGLKPNSCPNCGVARAELVSKTGRAKKNYVRAYLDIRRDGTRLKQVVCEKCGMRGPKSENGVRYWNALNMSTSKDK